MENKERLLAELDRCVLEMEDEEVVEVAKEYIEAGYDAYEGIIDGLAKGIEKIGDNEISKKLTEIIPQVDKIFINNDINETQDVPCIAYCTDGEEQLIKIKRRHKIVWSILNKYCTE